MNLAQRYLELRQKINSEVTLLVVSKGRPLEALQQLYEVGVRDFGENREKEALLKMERLPSDINWHFIGTLQRKRVKKVAKHFQWIHSVDSLEIAKELSLHPPVSCLVQVNTSREVSKHGFTSADLLESYQTLNRLLGERWKGLMTMAPLTNQWNEIRSCFRALRELKDQLKQELPILSMGMSRDYPIAIEEGATLIRIGRVLFDG